VAAASINPNDAAAHNFPWLPGSLIENDSGPDGQTTQTNVKNTTS
jgi:hypothetical protein